MIILLGLFFLSGLIMLPMLIFAVVGVNGTDRLKREREAAEKAEAARRHEELVRALRGQPAPAGTSASFDLS